MYVYTVCQLSVLLRKDYHATHLRCVTVPELHNPTFKNQFRLWHVLPFFWSIFQLRTYFLKSYIFYLYVQLRRDVSMTVDSSSVSGQMLHSCPLKRI